MAARIGRSPVEEFAQAGGHQFLDRGIESEVYRTGNSTVLKVREIFPQTIDDVLDKLCAIVYHNYLFPADAYVLHDFVTWRDGETDRFALVLEQRFVTPVTDADGYVVPPSQAQIEEALAQGPERFGIYEDDAAPEGTRIVAANGQYRVTDFQPGRNTFIDAATGGGQVHRPARFRKRSRDAGSWCGGWQARRNDAKAILDRDGRRRHRFRFAGRGGVGSGKFVRKFAFVLDMTACTW